VTPAPSHLELLAVARAVRRAAVVDDTDRLHTELSRLRTNLVRHVHAERDMVSNLPAPAARVVGDGQRRLLRLLDELLFASDDDAVAGCTCLVRAAEVELALRRQARLEAKISQRSAPPVSPPP
jgi:hypothetical protein